MWFRRGRLVIVSPDSRATACPLSGRNSTYRPVQISETSSKLRIFFDSNQRVYGTIAKLPDDVQVVPIRLTLNLRNTQQIHNVVSLQYEGHQIVSIGPEGVPVEWISANDIVAIKRKVDENVARLLSVEQVRPENIAILVENEMGISDLERSDRVALCPVTRCDRPRPGAVTVDTIRRFKGLECQVAIVVATSAFAVNKELPYVALSRARTKLLVIGQENLLSTLRSTH